MSTTNPLIFRIGEETKPVIVGQDNYKESLLGEQIEHAYNCILTIVKECSLESEWEGTLFSDIYHNNIVSYVGERGTGKTSCMYSVANLLRQKNGKDFYCLDAIDPSFFDEHHNILQIVIGKMFLHFNDSLKDLYENGKREHDTMELRRNFRETKKHLRFLDKEPEFEDDNEMEELERLASGVDLKKSLKKLVGEYLKFYGKKVLLISIDDIDQNFSRAYEMAEQIRKYLIIPGVIIQLAAKLDQFKDIIQNKMAAQYDHLKKDEKDSYTRDMADRYLVKLLPLESRIYMPNMEVFFEAPLIIENGKETIDIGDVKTTVTQLIFQKCRYLFYNTRGTTSYIVPRNLRELRMLVSMLVRMPDYYNKDGNGESIISGDNKDVFKNYFFSDWLNNLGDYSKSIAKELIEENEPTRFNKKVVHLLDEKFGHDFYGDNNPDYIIPIVAEKAASYNISFGDVFTYMDYISKTESQGDTAMLLFFIKSLYSIRLFEYYNMLVEKYSNTTKKDDSPKPYRRNDFLENVSYMQKFVGGNYYCINGESLIAKAADRTKDKERELRMIDGGVLNELIRDLNTRYATIQTKTTKERELFTQDLQLAEFFMLTIARFLYSKGGGKESGDYRKSTDVYYDRDLSKVHNMEFNVMAPFFHLLDIEHAYQRFHPKIFEIAKAWNDDKNECISLYNLLLKECHLRKNVPPELDLLSKSALRNAEIAEDLYSYLEEQRNKYRPDNGEIGVLASFYYTVFNYQIATYAKEKTGENTETSNHFFVRFIPFKVLAEFLIRCKDQTKFYRIYNKALVNKVTPYRFVDKSMPKENIWNNLVEMYPSLDTLERKNDFLYHFRSNKKYNKATIIQKLDILSKNWGMKLDGTSMTNE